ncbi:hypothetical protein MPSEU_000913700 [Mayamaea pseudoterrestris]|nr:hypothetical protein MPSEU_000913700 [Mayamaea pseudoterrestris]
MMFASTLVKGSARVVSRSVPQSVATRSFALSDTLQSKKKVEEERFIKEQEKKFFEKKKAELDSKQHENELKQFQGVIAPCMADIHEILEKTGDDISHEGYEAIAKWKLGIK